MGLTCAAPAVAQELPERKAGLWSFGIADSDPQTPASNGLLRLAADTDKALRDSVMKSTDCRQGTRRPGNSFIIDSTCKFGGRTIDSQSIYEGDFASAYPMTSSSTATSGAPRRPRVIP